MKKLVLRAKCTAITADFCQALVKTRLQVLSLVPLAVLVVSDLLFALGVMSEKALTAEVDLPDGFCQHFAAGWCDDC